MKTGLSSSTAPRLLAAGLLVSVLGTATGCRSADPVSEETPAVSSSSTPSASVPFTPGPTGSRSADASPTAAPDSGQPSEAGQSPQPAPEPTFNAAEEVFLEGKVPEGMDPNAVLQVGQERCDVLVNAKASDPEAVLSELITNPSQESADAIRNLCTDLLPDLEGAALGFPDGVFGVGVHDPRAEEPSIGPGTYRAYPGTEGCSISVYAGSGALIGEYDASAPVVIATDAGRVDSSQCYSWFRS